MEASQLKINPDKLRFQPMSHASKLKLRRENIKALIRSKPAGTIIRPQEFAKVAATQTNLAMSMVGTMIKNGEVLRIPDEQYKKRYSYAVSDGAVKKQGQTTVTFSSVASLQPDPLIMQAKTFAWETNSDSLREFMKWLNK